MADINLTAEQVAALILSIGDKSKLKTEEKQTLVDAINNVLDMRVNPERLSALMRQFEAQLSNIYASDIPAVPYVDNFTEIPIQTLAVERTNHEQMIQPHLYSYHLLYMLQVHRRYHLVFPPMRQ